MTPQDIRPGATPRSAWSPPPMRPVLHLVAGMLLALGALMLLPAAADLVTGHPDWVGFAFAAVATLAGGAALFRATRCPLAGGLSLRQAFVLTPLAWTATASAAAVPFFLSTHPGLSGDAANAFFEAMSGLTTTGSTVVTGLDDAPPGVLLWRALLQWAGGIGIIAVAVAILPALGVGGMQLFRTENSDRSEKVMPRARQVAVAIGKVYLGLTVLCAAAYWLAGMAPFDAVAHALTTISTAGFSTSDGSLGNWDAPAIHWVAVAGMLAGAVPFVMYVRLLQGSRDGWRDSQAMTLLGFLAVVVAAVALALFLAGRYGFWDALRHAAVNVVSVVTTTGYATTDYLLWGNAAIGLFFGLTFIGGCTGSTTGGMKIFRFQVMAAMLRVQFLRLVFPRGVFPRTYAGRVLPDEVVGSVVVYFSLYFVCYGLLTIALMALDLDFATSASAAVTSLSNVGPGIGDVIGPAGNFAPLPDTAKWLLSFAMLLGRLELFTVLVLFMPRFWRG
jgi:trk system potassium uptake protein TrkH